MEVHAVQGCALPAADPPPLPLFVGRAPPRGRRALIALAFVGVCLIVGYVVFLRATQIVPPPIDDQERASAELPLEARGARAYVGNSWMGRERGVWEVHLEGEPYAIGWAHGRLAQHMHQLQEEQLFSQFER